MCDIKWNLNGLKFKMYILVINSNLIKIGYLY
jgi:hypothetical protein